MSMSLSDSSHWRQHRSSCKKHRYHCHHRWSRSQDSSVTSLLLSLRNDMSANHATVCGKMQKISDRVTAIEEQSPPTQSALSKSASNREQSLSTGQDPPMSENTGEGEQSSCQTTTPSCEAVPDLSYRTAFGLGWPTRRWDPGLRWTIFWEPIDSDSEGECQIISTPTSRVMQ